MRSSLAARGTTGLIVTRRGRIALEWYACPGIRRYLMALGYDHSGAWGLFDAPEPWGPWTTILHRQWDIAGTHGYRLPAKWISPGGSP